MKWKREKIEQRNALNWRNSLKNTEHLLHMKSRDKKNKDDNTETTHTRREHNKIPNYELSQTTQDGEAREWL